MQQTLASILLIALIIAAVVTARNKARASKAARRGMLVKGTLAIGLGAIFVLVLPRYLPETPGSPGTLVGVALLWVTGALIIGVGVTILLGALLGSVEGQDHQRRGNE